VHARRAAALLAGVAALSAVAPHPVTAQASAANRLRPLLTLELWSDDIWLALTDRDGSYFGRLAEQGAFQRFNVLMDREYELDLRTGLFSEYDDARWVAAQRGLRAAAASINHPFILNVTDWRERVPITERVHFVARYRRQRTLTAQRDYPTVGLSWEPAMGAKWTLGVGVGMHFFKSSADVELSLRRRWARSRDTLTLDARLAVLDAFTNVIFNALGVEPEETPAHFLYDAPPVASRVAATWSSGAVRAELHAGSSNRSAVEVSFPSSGEPSYDQHEQVSFLGALAEWAPAARVRVGAYATTARAATDRRFAPETDAGAFRLRERTHVVGVRGAATLRGPVLVELGFEGVRRPEQRDRGDGTDVRHDDRERLAQIALVRRPPTGTTFRVGYAFDDRAAGVLAPWLTAMNQRLPVEYGYHFRRGFDVAVGVRWDLDQGLANPFDGGHLRFSATW
jgi:hypothetical protein